MPTVARWQVHEVTFASSCEYSRPDVDVALEAVFSSPTGERRAVDAFWDGDATWRARFSPDEVGPWQWETRCSDESNAGLHGRSGEIECVPYEDDNPLHQHGAVRVSEAATAIRPRPCAGSRKALPAETGGENRSSLS